MRPQQNLDATRPVSFAGDLEYRNFSDLQLLRRFFTAPGGFFWIEKSGAKDRISEIQGPHVLERCRLQTKMEAPRPEPIDGKSVKNEIRCGREVKFYMHMSNARGRGVEDP